MQRQQAVEPALELHALAGLKRGDLRRPCRAGGRAAATGGAPGVEDVLRHDERLMRPVERLAGAFDFLRPKRFAMALGRACALGRAVADGCLAGDQRRLAGFLRRLDCREDGVLIVPVDARRVPAAASNRFS